MKTNRLFIAFAFACLYNVTNAQVAKIPFEFFNKSYILIKLPLSNSKDSLIYYFDTGAGGTVIDSTTASKIGLVSNYEQPTAGASGITMFRAALYQTVNISKNIKIDSVNIVIGDLSRLQESLERKFDGIIGYNILTNYKTKIDFDNKVIELYPFNTKLDTHQYEEINFSLGNGTPIPQLPVTIELQNGKKFTDTVFFDSGAGISLIVNTPFKIKNNLLANVGKTISSESDNLNAKSTAQGALIKSIQIGKFKLGENVIELASDTAGVSAMPGYLGLLGNVVISRFNVILDYSKNKLYLKPNRFFNDPFELPVGGVHLKYKNGAIIISGIDKSGDAYIKGLRNNDTIMSINGVKTSDIHVYRKMLKKENSTVEVIYKTTNDELKKTKIKLVRLL